MVTPNQSGSSERLRIAFELADAGVDMMRHTIRRRSPEMTSDEVEEQLNDWLGDRPPDGPSRPRPLQG